MAGSARVGLSATSIIVYDTAVTFGAWYLWMPPHVRLHHVSASVHCCQDIRCLKRSKR